MKMEMEMKMKMKMKMKSYILDQSMKIEKIMC